MSSDVAGPVATRTVVATADPPPSGVPNPIHDDEGAVAAGYQGALVAGVRTYGWAVQALVDALGDGWLDEGWVDFSLRRPLFAGEELTTAVRLAGEAVAFDAVAGAGSRVVLDGIAGSGRAAWLADLDPPKPARGEDPPEVRPTYTVDTAPLGSALRPLAVHVSSAAAVRLVRDDLAIDDDRYTSSTPARIHPYFLAGRMFPLTRHNFTYGPTIHVRSQIQHCGRPLADQQITVGARLVSAYERRGHWYQILDGVVSGEGGETLAIIRHHTIFRPRGTELPVPSRRGG